LENTDEANELIQTELFRPPHGHMRWGQYMILRNKYRIVMWDLVTRDYSKCLNGPQVLGKVKKYVRNGSIITFHDSIKSEKNLKYALPKAIEWLLEQGYEFKVFD
jgi:peptidoglycan/xylan/chitin deacetylase (PgdA/CDA1 family)